MPKVYLERSNRLVGMKKLICHPSRKSRRGRGRITRILSFLYFRVRVVSHF